MAWIGVTCEIEAWELRKWGAHLQSVGGVSAGKVADLLERCAKLVGGETAGMHAEDRMLEVERRATQAVERMRADAAAKAGALIGHAMGKGADMPSIMKAVGLDGWRDGSAAGGKNGGVKARNKKRFGSGGTAVPDKNGDMAVIAERGRPARAVLSTVSRDARYGETYEGWAGVEMRKAGFKMSRIAKALDMDPAEAWRHISGWSKHWRREALSGRAFPGVPADWPVRYREACDRALNKGVKGARVVLNGGGGIGIGSDDGMLAPANSAL